VDGILIESVDVLFVGGNLGLDFASFTLPGSDCPKVFGNGIVPFSTPGDIVYVGELRIRMLALGFHGLVIFDLQHRR